MTTKQLCVIGDPISHSASPAMHNAMIKVLGIDFQYSSMPVRSDDLSSFFSSLSSKNIVGVNVTIPHKEAVIPFLDVIDEDAKRIGAVNTIVATQDGLKGHNTDGEGFIYALEQEMERPFSFKQVIILGAGGSSRSLAYSFLKQGVQSVFIANRTLARAERLSEELAGFFTSQRVIAVEMGSDACTDALDGSDLVVNTTSVGMDGETIPLSNMSWLKPSQVVCDIIYSPWMTPFLSVSSDRVSMVMNGVGMLAAQGALAFELFTGSKADYNVMKTAATQFIKGEK